MLTEKEAQEIKKEIDECQRPIYFFHDDPDGLASYLMIYRYKKEGKGITVKASPRITTDYLRQVREYGADKVFVLDIAQVDQEFVDEVKLKVVWIDHHQLQEIEGAKYYNPQRRGVNVPTPALIYQALQTDLWLAVIGCIGDWHIPSIAEEFIKQYPDLLDKNITTPEEALFNTPAGKIAKIFSFNLKGNKNNVQRSFNTLPKIKTPYEILNQETPAGKLIYSHYEYINKTYEELLKNAKKQAKKDELILFTYEEDKLSLTRDLSNEMMYLYPDKTIIIAREKNDEVKCSIRSKKNIKSALAKSLQGIQGYGGGHENACGAVIKKEDFQRFIENFKEQINL